MASEYELMNEIILAVRRKGYRCYRNGVAGASNSYGIEAGYGVGSPDLMGYVPVKMKWWMVHQTVAVAFMIEVNKPDGRLKEHQQAAIEDLEADGVRAGVATNTRQALEIIRGCRKLEDYEGPVQSSSRTSEHQLMNEIILAVRREGYRCHRNEVSGPKNKYGIEVGYGVGSPDLMGYAPVRVTRQMVGQTVAVAFMIEVKKPDGRLKEHQQAAIEDLEADGVRAGVATNTRQALRIIRGRRKLKHYKGPVQSSSRTYTACHAGRKVQVQGEQTFINEKEAEYDARMARQRGRTQPEQHKTWRTRAEELADREAVEREMGQLGLRHKRNFWRRFLG